MKSIIAGALVLVLHTLGFAVGCGIWAVIGWCLGSLLSHAPITGALCGLAYQLWAYIYQHEQMWDSIQRAYTKFMLVLDRASA